MANILDYLDWRGDLTLAQAPFNEVDNLILAELAFVDCRGIVPGVGEGKGIPLADAADAFFRKAQQQPELVDMGVLIPDSIPLLLEKMACSRRFGAMVLSCRAEHLDNEKAEQFAALAVELGEGTVYLAYRGTDDTLAGWKEDFLLACRPVIPAQKRALEYACLAAKQYPRKKLMLGGHSKGGNLAVFAGVFAPAAIQRRITAIWSNDGPGFHADLVDLAGYRAVADRIHSIIPKSSVVGMLLEHSEDYTVVDSDQKGLLQHDGFSWQVLGSRFLRLREVTRGSQLGDAALRRSLEALPVEQRGRLVDALFDVLTASGAETLADLRTDKLKTAGAMVKAMADLDRETREGLFDLVTLLFRSGAEVLLEEIQAEGEKKALEWSKRREEKEK